MYNNIIKRIVWIFRIFIICMVIFECVALHFHYIWMQMASIGGIVLLVSNDIFRYYYGKCKSGWVDFYSHIKIIVLTTFQEDEYIFGSLKSGADGYVYAIGFQCCEI